MQFLTVPRVTLLGAALAAGGCPAAQGAAPAQQARPVVALDCAAAEARLPGACRALKDALRAIAPGAVQRVMDDLSRAPTRPGDLALALRIADARVRLDWRHGADALRPGPSAPLRPGAAPGPLVRRLLADLPDPLRPKARARPAFDPPEP
ncbi:hypothetical protein ILP92_16465 [Maribius pontilimi]|uniref:Uncharacterized protein n=1 Tax=Palleronia pontilimi TaxID=1964209 RepID=A0A934IJY9_9RHOB|nr:hypothetical protein [Palleronia pontilimi]MBJ3764336.1 hypothetical protein [Palleronia pontilimi]